MRRPDADNFPSRVLGNVAWPGERWLDIRNTDVILPLMRERFRSAAAKGCHGIDADNMNAWLEDSGFPITEEEQLEYNIYIGQEIKVLGMLAGLKNAHQQAFSLLPYFDLVAVLGTIYK
ncbi:uncharacterized protein LOC118439415 [Folsomia candida]|uniref:uncharacterized protein LOC118439415 n=1 Tax=Folsomia candida TaxID=158441 RepID=UPI0016051381|nr:uncharacterized protein LOC118439415 [Folsomia candida]